MLREYGVDGRLSLAVKPLYSCSEERVPLDGVKSQPFSVGLRQWCVLSPVTTPLYTSLYQSSPHYAPGAKFDLRSHFTPS